MCPIDHESLGFGAVWESYKTFRRKLAGGKYVTVGRLGGFIAFPTSYFCFLDMDEIWQSTLQLLLPCIFFPTMRTPSLQKIKLK